MDFVVEIEKNLAEFVALSRYWSAAQSRVDGACVWAVSDVPFYTLNNVTGARLTSDTAVDVIGQVVRLGEERRVPIMWWVGPSSTPADLGDSLAAQGFVKAGAIPGMAVRLDALKSAPPTPDLFEITLVEDDEARQLVARLSGAGVGLPGAAIRGTEALFASIAAVPDVPFDHFIGWLAGEPVAIVSMLRDGKTVGIYNVVTMPEARQKGIGGAITHYALRVAQERGAELGVLHSSPMGFGVYEKLGFQMYCEFALYLWGQAFIAES